MYFEYSENINNKYTSTVLLLFQIGILGGSSYLLRHFLTLDRLLIVVKLISWYCKSDIEIDVVEESRNTDVSSSHSIYRIR